MMEQDGQTYKVELIEEHAGKGEPISLYRWEIYRSCAGPHLMSTGAVKAVKLTNCTGALLACRREEQNAATGLWDCFPKGRRTGSVFGPA